MNPSPYLGHGAGKLILFGEHAVVRGAPAIACGLDRGCEVLAQPAHNGPATLSLFDATNHHAQLDTVRAGQEDSSLARAWSALCRTLGLSDAPLHLRATLHVFPGAGLGSSASLAVAAARALLRATHQTEAMEARVAAACEAAEGIFHGRASGVDQAAAMRPGLLRFVRNPAPTITPILAHAPLTLAVCLAAPGASTAHMVQQVSQRIERLPQQGHALDTLIAQISDAALHAIITGDLAQVGELMDLNHGALAALGVSTEPLDAACHVARSAGALGAKLTGAGGGGCVIALVEDDPTAVIEAWAQRGWRGFSATIAPSPAHNA